MSQVIETVPLHLAASERYLSYALSVITSRALPDVRDGLKPVQRRILYAMYNDMGLVSSGRYRKCAAVVGEVMGKYHPHGDQSIYDALARMAQDFSVLAPLVDGQGNFGSLDGDPPAAMRYTECRLQPIAEELLSEIKKQTVDFRLNYDGQRTEPVVLPAQFPHLLVNGSEGIAVGMATRIPPHNLAEIVTACIALIEDRSLTVHDLVGLVKAPDFPTGGRILTSPGDIEKIYETGQGTLKVRATWAEVDEDAGRQIVLDSVPYGQNKSKIVEHIGEEVRLKRLPQVVDVRDESTDKVRIVLDLQPGASAEAVMAYLFKRTDLQTTWPVNLTALVPVGGTDVPGPARLDLKQILEYWLDFRLETVRRRYRYDLELLRQRIHILEGFEKIFDALDEAIRLIRRSDGRKDAAAKLIARFELSGLQADAVLELQLYKLAKLEIEAIRAELADKRERADHIEKILASEQKLWNEVKKELREIRKHHGSARRTLLGEEGVLEYDENAYIVAEDTYVVVTRDGWIKRQSSYRGLDKVRVREGDEIGWLVKADTRSTLTLFTNQGGAYVLRVDGIPQTSGYGEPVQASFTFADGEVLVSVLSNDDRHRIPARPPATPEDPAPPYAAAITVGGRGMRFPLPPHTEISNRTGRRFARLLDDDQVLAVWGLPNVDDRVCLATSRGRTVALAACELPILKTAGKGLPAVELQAGEQVVAFELGTAGGGGPVVEHSGGRKKSDVQTSRWLRAPIVLDQEPARLDAEALRSLPSYRTLPRTTPTPAERQALAEQRAAERQALAEKRAAEKQALAERKAEKQALAEKQAVEKQALAETRAEERRAAAERRAAERLVLAEQKEVEKQQKAAERQAAAERRAAEQQAAAEHQAALRQEAAVLEAAAAQEAAARAAEKRALAEQRAAEKQAAAAQESAERRAAAEQRAAEKQLAAEREAERKAAEKLNKEAERQAAEEQRELEKQQLAAERRVAAERRAAEQQVIAAQQAVERQAAAERKAVEKRLAAEKKEQEKQAAAAERQAAAAARAAADRMEAERKVAEKQAAAEEKAAEREAARQAAAEEKAAEREAAKQAAVVRAAEKQAAAERLAAEREAAKQAAAAATAAEKQAAAAARAEKQAEAERLAAERAAAKLAAAEKLAAERQEKAERAAARLAAAENKAAEKQEQAAEKRAAAERRAAEQQAAAERAARMLAAAQMKAAEKQQAAAEKQAAAESREAERQRAAAESRAAAEQRAAEKQAAVERKEAERRLIAEQKAVEQQAAAVRAAEKQAAAERRETEKQQKAAEKQAAADRRAAEQRAAAERAVEKQAAAEKKETEKQEKAEARQAAAEARQAAEAKQAAAARQVAARAQEKPVSAKPLSAKLPPATPPIATPEPAEPAPVKRVAQKPALAAKPPTAKPPTATPPTAKPAAERPPAKPPVPAKAPTPAKTSVPAKPASDERPKASGKQGPVARAAAAKPEVPVGPPVEVSGSRVRPKARARSTPAEGIDASED